MGRRHNGKQVRRAALRPCAVPGVGTCSHAPPRHHRCTGGDLSAVQHAPPFIGSCLHPRLPRRSWSQMTAWRTSSQRMRATSIPASTARPPPSSGSTPPASWASCRSCRWGWGAYGGQARQHAATEPLPPHSAAARMPLLPPSAPPCLPALPRPVSLPAPQTGPVLQAFYRFGPFDCDPDNPKRLIPRTPDGPPLFMLTGLGSTMIAWGLPLLRALATTHEVRRGRGLAGALAGGAGGAARRCPAQSWFFAPAYPPRFPLQVVIMEYRGAGLSKNLGDEPWNYYNQVWRGGPCVCVYVWRWCRGTLLATAGRPRRVCRAPAPLPARPQAEAVLLLADALGVPRFNWMGWSSGGNTGGWVGGIHGYPAGVAGCGVAHMWSTRGAQSDVTRGGGGGGGGGGQHTCTQATSPLRPAPLRRPGAGRTVRRAAGQDGQPGGHGGRPQHQ